MRKKMRRRINCYQSKFSCKLSLTEHAKLKELVKQKEKSKEGSFEAKWLQFFNPQIISYVIEFFKAMF